MVNDSPGESDSEAVHPFESDRPILVWDGSCDFCRRTVNWLRSQVSDDVRFVPYQQLSADFDAVDQAEFQRSVFLFRPSGEWCRGAEAVFECLALGPGPACSSWLYRYLPGFDRLAEWTYRFVAEHRSLFATVSWLSWGSNDQPSRWYFARWMFLRGLALVFLIAFVSLWGQILGLIGPDGIVPAESTVQRARELMSEGKESWYAVIPRFPSLFLWFDPTGTVLQVCCVVGSVLSVLLFAGFWPRGLLVLLWALYLSLIAVGGPFLSYQWDTLLLESSFLALFIAPAQFLPGGDQRRVSVRGVFLLQWLLFRVMFSSGFVKLLSLDPVWHDGTAMSYHFWTQPLPNQISYYAHQLPPSLLQFATAGTFFVELLVPFLFFAPRMVRRIAGLVTIGLQITIIATGNYGFFNYLTIVLCFFLIDDAFWRSWVPSMVWSIARYPEEPESSSGTVIWKAGQVGHALIILLLFVGTSLLLVRQVQNSRAAQTSDRIPVVQIEIPSWFENGYSYLRGFRTFNTYGLFANMTTVRPEIVIEGSRTGSEWKQYRFPWKPDTPKDSPRQVAPHQPRLDWQMWFQALSMHRRARRCAGLLKRIGVQQQLVRRQVCLDARWLERTDVQLLRGLSRSGVKQPVLWSYRNVWGYESWFLQFLQGLLNNQKAILHLVEHNPFPDNPPKYIRVKLEYLRFPSDSVPSGDWWVREKQRNQGWYVRLRDGTLTPATAPE